VLDIHPPPAKVHEQSGEDRHVGQQAGEVTDDVDVALAPREPGD
jgi:hypothetical protein